MKKTIIIEGMSCSHCSSRVEQTLSAIDGVQSAKVSLEDKSATVELSKPIEDEVFNNEIYNVGYDVISIEDVE